MSRRIWFFALLVIIILSIPCRVKAYDDYDYDYDYGGYSYDYSSQERSTSNDISDGIQDGLTAVILDDVMSNMPDKLAMFLCGIIFFIFFVFSIAACLDGCCNGTNTAPIDEHDVNRCCVGLLTYMCVQCLRRR
jgi:hypothetical protein